MVNDIAVIAAHPDDEVLGCGGTIARHAAMGDRVHILILAEGATSRDPLRRAEQRREDLSALKTAARAAAEVLGAVTLEFGGFADNRMDGVELLDVVKVVEAFLVRHRPRIIYTHHGGDLNVDHQVTQRAVSTALRPLPGAAFSTLLYFEVPSSTEWGNVPCAQPFVPQWFEDVSCFLARKQEALRAYQGEMRVFPHPRSYEGVEALARMRGSTAGFAAAEAFMLGWYLNRWENVS
jgi:LmbE family N-acetylglucosaminyl deacetylase